MRFRILGFPWAHPKVCKQAAKAHKKVPFVSSCFGGFRGFRMKDPGFVGFDVQGFGLHTVRCTEGSLGFGVQGLGFRV